MATSQRPSFQELQQLTSRMPSATIVPGCGFDGAANIKVCVRLRPFSRREVEQREKRCVLMPTASTVCITHPLNGEERSFDFDRAYCSFDPAEPAFASQQTLQDELGSDLVDAAMQGYNVCLFTYGQTGSGKTFSMMGTENPSEMRGLLPRMVEGLFAQIEERKRLSDSSLFTMSVSFMEICNDQIRDLLKPPSPATHKLSIRQNATFGVYVQGLTDNPVFSEGDVHRLIAFGLKSRAVAATSMSGMSSRSHCIFTLELKQSRRTADDRKLNVRCKMNLVDIAGSERQKNQAGAELMVNSFAINQSLSGLLMVISKLVDISDQGLQPGQGNEDVPFRSSKLTYLLQDSLCGNSKTAMLATLSPASCNYDATLSTLVFAENVRRIRVQARANEEYEEQLAAALREELEQLKIQVMAGQVDEHDFEAAGSLVERYSRDIEDQIRLAREHEETRVAALAYMGLSVGEIASCAGAEKGCPMLISMSSDYSTEANVMNFLPVQQLIPVGSASDCKLVLKGPGMMPVTAIIQTQDDVRILVSHVHGRVLVNGVQVQGKVALRHGDRLTFGHEHFFRVLIPSSIQDVEYERLERQRLEEVLMTVFPEGAGERFFQCLHVVKEISGRMGEAKAQSFIIDLRKAVAMVDEANAMAKEMRPMDRLEFSVEANGGLFTDTGQPECVVRLRQGERGKARWRNVVRRRLARCLGRRGGEGIDDNVPPSFTTVYIETLRALLGRLHRMRKAYTTFRDGGTIDFTSNDPWIDWVVDSTRDREVPEHGAPAGVIMSVGAASGGEKMSNLKARDGTDGPADLASDPRTGSTANAMDSASAAPRRSSRARQPSAKSRARSRSAASPDAARPTVVAIRRSTLPLATQQPESRAFSGSLAIQSTGSSSSSTAGGMRMIGSQALSSSRSSLPSVRSRRSPQVASKIFGPLEYNAEEATTPSDADSCYRADPFGVASGIRRTKSPPKLLYPDGSEKVFGGPARVLSPSQSRSPSPASPNSGRRRGRQQPLSSAWSDYSPCSHAPTSDHSPVSPGPTRGGLDMRPSSPTYSRRSFSPDSVSPQAAVPPTSPAHFGGSQSPTAAHSAAVPPTLPDPLRKYLSPYRPPVSTATHSAPLPPALPQRLLRSPSPCRAITSRETHIPSALAALPDHLRTSISPCHLQRAGSKDPLGPAPEQWRGSPIRGRAQTYSGEMLTQSLARVSLDQSRRTWSPQMLNKSIQSPQAPASPSQFHRVLPGDGMQSHHPFTLPAASPERRMISSPQVPISVDQRPAFSPPPPVSLDRRPSASPQSRALLDQRLAASPRRSQSPQGSQPPASPDRMCRTVEAQHSSMFAGSPTQVWRVLPLGTTPNVAAPPFHLRRSVPASPASPTQFWRVLPPSGGQAPAVAQKTFVAPASPGNMRRSATASKVQGPIIIQPSVTAPASPELWRRSVPAAAGTPIQPWLMVSPDAVQSSSGAKKSPSASDTEADCCHALSAACKDADLEVRNRSSHAGSTRASNVGRSLDSSCNSASTS